MVGGADMNVAAVSANIGDGSHIFDAHQTIGKPVDTNFVLFYRSELAARLACLPAFFIYGPIYRLPQSFDRNTISFPQRLNLRKRIGHLCIGSLEFRDGGGAEFDHFIRELLIHGQIL
jgi:hypothetical protein